MRLKLMPALTLLSAIAHSANVHAAPWNIQPISVQVASDTATGRAGPQVMMTPTGSLILLATSGNNILSGVRDLNLEYDVVLHDRQTDTDSLPIRSGLAGNYTPGGHSIPRAISPDGRWVLFDSSASDAAPGMVETGWFGPDDDVFLHDRQSGTTQLVSHRSDSAVHTGSAESHAVALSSDGRWVLYASFAQDLVAGVSGYNGRNVFLFDRLSNSSRLVTRDHGSASTSADAGSRATAMSADGRWILLASEASNLVNGFTSGNGGQEDVYLYDRDTESMVLVSHVSASASAGGDHRSEPVALSPDGRWVLFDSYASNLLASVVDDNNRTDVFRYDRTNGQLVLVSHAHGIPQQVANEESAAHSISDDGARVLLRSNATNLLAGVTDGNASSDVFLREVSGGTTLLVSRSANAAVAADGQSTPAGLSGDGSRVLFTSTATNVAGMTLDGNGADPDLFRFESASGVVGLVAHQAGAPTISPGAGVELWAMDSSGRWLTFGTSAVNVVAGLIDRNREPDAFLADTLTGDTRLLARAGNTDPQTANRESVGASISSDGRWVLAGSRATNLLADLVDENNDRDVFVFDRQSGGAYLVSHAAGAPATAANQSSWPLAISGDGRWVLFESYASNLVDGVTDNNGQTDVFLHDRQSGSTVLVSRVADQMTTSDFAASYGVGVSDDGRWVLFHSTAADLVSGVTDELGFEDAFLFDRMTGQSQLVSHAVGAPLLAADNDSTPFGLSADGRYVAYRSRAANLVAGLEDANGTDDVFLFDRVSGDSVAVSRAAVGVPTAANGGSYGLRISRNGQRVLFSSGATNLVDGVADLNGLPDMFLFDAGTNSVRLISRSAQAPGQTASGMSIEGVLNANGSRVLWQSDASDIVFGVADANSVNDVFLYDYAADSSTLMSHSAGNPGLTANGESLLGTISGNGGTIGFRSVATNLIAGIVDLNQEEDVILRRIALGENRMASLSADAASSTADRYTSVGAMSHDGRYVLMSSEASDLAASAYDANGYLDVFVAVDPETIFGDSFED